MSSKLDFPLAFGAIISNKIEEWEKAKGISKKEMQL